MEGKSMYKVAICDDDQYYIEELREIVLECNGNKREIQFFEFYSGNQLLSSHFHDMDLIFLDIHMPGLDGNETAVKLKEQGYQGVLVQCSGKFMPTPETIKISPYRYLLKKDPKEKTLLEMKDVLAQMEIQKMCYEIEGSYLRQKIKFQVGDIVYITHHQKGSVLHLCSEKAKKYQEGNIIVSYDFKQLLEILKATDFAVPHNSYIVNLRYVSAFDPKNEVLVADGTRLSVSRGKKASFFRELTNYTRKNVWK